MPDQRRVSSLPATVDSLIALGIAVAAVVWANKQQVPEGTVREFLQVRITILNASFAIVFAILWKKCMEVLGLFQSKFVELLRPTLLTATGCAIMTALLALFLVARRAQGPVRQVLATFFIVAFVYEMARLLVFSRPLHWSIGEPDRVIIVGTGRRASMAWRELRTQHHGSKCLLGFVDDRNPTEMPPDMAGRLLCRIDELSAYLLSNVVDELIVASPMRSCHEPMQRAISAAESAGIRVVCLNDIFTLRHGHKLRQRTCLFFELLPKDNTQLFAESIKRALDVLISIAALVFLAPLCIVIALAVRLTSPGPVFFVQERYGWHRHRFRMWKFRSMVQDAPEMMASLEIRNEASGPIFKIKADPRITLLGSFLRRTSLDELPQLFNVLLGDMSLVGPRPMSIRDVSRFGETSLMRRFSVRPGITGNWQVSGRSSLSFDQWIALDLSYIDDWSLALDVKILARTLPAVLKGSGAM